MSEYQYYEFQALDRPLTHKAQEEMRRLSSRVQLTATSALFVYNFGDFRGNPYWVLAQYFDAMLYITSWGTRQLMFRFPANTIPDDVMDTYQFPDCLEWSAEGECVILNMEFNDEEGGDGWLEGEGMLAGMIPLRDDLLHGDWRALYLAWLKSAHYEADLLEDDEDLTEPPVPSNLQKLSPALGDFIAFFDLNRDLVRAAAWTSVTSGKMTEDLSGSIDRLTEAEKRAFLERLLNGESHLDIALAKRLRELAGTAEVEPSLAGRRTIRQLLAASKAVEQGRREVERQQAEAARLKKLEKVARQEDQLWAQIPGLIEQKRANTYDETVRILRDLHDLAAHQQRMARFEEKLAAIRSQYPTLHGLHRRLKEARVI